MTPRQLFGVWPGEGGSHREFSLLPIGHLGVICDSQPHGALFFIAIGFRVNNVPSLPAGDTYDIQVTNRKHGWILILPPS